MTSLPLDQKLEKYARTSERMWTLKYLPITSLPLGVRTFRKYARISDECVETGRPIQPEYIYNKYRIRRISGFFSQKYIIKL